MKNDSYILIVEDSHIQAKQIEAVLKPVGYSVSIAYSGKGALTSSLMR